MQKLSHQLAGELGETLALAKFVSLGLHAYISPPGAPGHDIIIVMPDGPKSVEVKTRQFISKATEIGRWPVDMNTKANADYFLFIELDLRTLEPTFYLLNNAQAKSTHTDSSGSGNCHPNKVRSTVEANDFSALTGGPPEPEEQLSPDISLLGPQNVTSDLRRIITQEATFNRYRIVRYSSQSIDVYLDGARQDNTIGSLRDLAKKVGVSEYNSSGGVRNTRQLGKAVIEAVNERK
ncbi:hypothetical protein [Aliiroseovarius marinus]|uniref:hypothetical protein n=1 Tax=Aliiroseovarius marinus TaxID=2500159 RepID=UPI00249463C3|nr:hypothetical protein [Aliiroseovarius marinus]